MPQLLVISRLLLQENMNSKSSGDVTNKSQSLAAKKFVVNVAACGTTNTFMPEEEEEEGDGVRILLLLLLLLLNARVKTNIAATARINPWQQHPNIMIALPT